MRDKIVGFLGGSFDPIHLGHLNLAITIFEQVELDLILFCPAHISPTKQHAPPIASSEHRLNMVRISLEGIPFCRAYEAELDRPPPSYTIDTIRGIDVENIKLIVYEDVAYTLDQWKDAEELLRLAPPLVGSSTGFDRKKLDRLPRNIRSILCAGVCRIPLMDISSTMIRDRLRRGRYCRHLLLEKVVDYIHQNRLYCDA